MKDGERGKAGILELLTAGGVFFGQSDDECSRAGL